jgi:HD domain
MEKEIAGIKIPDSRLASEATQLAREASSPMLFNHVMRSYLFGELLARKHGLKYDPELLYLATVLHDLGLTDRFQGPLRFEVDGANAAREFLTARGVPPEKTALVWDAIALHSSPGIALYKEPEVAAAALGIGVDVPGFGADELPAGALEQVVAAYPRLRFKVDFMQSLVEMAKRKPQVTFGSFLVDVGLRHIPGFSCPNFCDLMGGAPFAE